MKVMMMALTLLMGAHSYAADRKLSDGHMRNAPMKSTQLDDLIRGEMAAVKTYDQVLEKVKDPKEASRLNSIRKDHVNAVATLKRYANADVKEDTQSSGAWGTFTEAWTGGAKLFGNKTALKALSEGEEHGINEYKEALNDETISPDLKRMIKAQFLPHQEEHIKTLKTFM